jgi:hypothetical protein
MGSSEHARDAIARARRNAQKTGVTPTVQIEHVEELDYVVLPEHTASGISSDHIKKGEVLLFLNPVFLSKESVDNITSRGPNALIDRVKGSKGVFILARETDIADIIKGMINNAIEEARK